MQDIIANPNKHFNESIDNLSKRTREQRSADYAKYNTYAAFKSGGKIKELPAKFQYGGNLGNTTTKEVVKSTEGLRTDITSTHKMNNSDGGLTKAEQLQITAAVGDLIGVGVSLAPGAGNVLGSALGLGSTATQLIADIKKDGFQGKDL